MTVSSENNSTAFTPNGSLQAFDFTFKYFNTNDVLVKIDGVLINASGYTVTMDSSGEGGTVTFDSAPTGSSGIIYRELDFTQETRIPTADKLGRGTIETAIDKITMLAQQVKEITDRCLQIPIALLTTFNGELPAPIANRALMINGTANGLALSSYNPDDAANAVSASEAAIAAASTAASSEAAASNSASAASASAASAAAVGNGVLTTKGDIVVHNGTTAVRLPIGTNAQVLAADSTQAAGAKWSDISSPTAASQSEQESMLSTSKFVSPACQHFHPSAAKAWLRYDRNTSTLAASNGVLSVTDGGTGVFTITWTTVFSSVNYCTVGSANASTVYFSSKLVGSVVVSMAT